MGNGTLPRRRNPPSISTTTPPSKFHFRNDQDSSSPSDSDSDDGLQASSSFSHIHPPQLKLKLKAKPHLVSSSPPDNVPVRPPAPIRVTRTNSTPILLSNGKPLKSSLKSSSSTPTIQSPTTTTPAATERLRASSTPNTPACLEPDSPSTSKNVHFPSTNTDLATVRLYSRSARPASISLPLEDTETETESERTPSSFPFPRIPSFPSSHLSHTQLYGNTRGDHELDPSRSSLVPAPAPPQNANVHLESLVLHSEHQHLGLKGTLLVRNLAYEKSVAVRFTLDDWDTTSEVSAHYVASLPSLPPALYVPGSGLIPSVSARSSSLEDLAGKAKGVQGTPAWDRFAFMIRLDDYAHSLSTRTLWLVSRYTIPAPVIPPGMPMPDDAGVGGSAASNEWWDNNGGGNYKVAFRVSVEEKEASSTLPTGKTFSAAIGRVPTRLPVTLPTIFRTPPPPPPITLTSASPPPLPYLSRLRSLSLKNYAAPSPIVSPTHSTSSVGFPTLSPSPSASTLSPPDGERTPSLSSADASPLTTPTDLPPIRMIDGFPATLGMGGDFGPGAGLGLGGVDSTAFTASNGHAAKEARQRNGHEEHAEKLKESGIALYWPWARPSSGDRKELLVEKKEKEEQARAEEERIEHTPAVSTPYPSIPHALHPLTQARMRSPSPQLSDSSSSGSSSESRKPRFGRRVFNHTISPSPPSPPVRHGSPVVGVRSTLITPTPPPSFPRLSPPISTPDEQKGSDTEADRVYQALVRKWCFAPTGFVR
ncbi:hypothetical protein DXG01_004847 [Tephrocybe rancida]|nr:hypothetical protein DXG01_004847 [Tephrocybe rancida]